MRANKRKGESYVDYVTRMKMAEDLTARKVASDVISLAQQRMLDYVTVALGELGWTEKEFIPFSQKLAEVDEHFEELLIDDYHNDPDYWYSHQKLDDAIKPYVGSLFCEYKKRYHLEEK